MVTLYRLAVTVPLTSLLQIMFFWDCKESMRSTSTRLASFTWISTVPSSETLTSDLETLRPSGLAASAGLASLGSFASLGSEAGAVGSDVAGVVDDGSDLSGMAGVSSSSSRTSVAPGDLPPFAPEAG